MAGILVHSLAECRTYLKRRLDDCFFRKDDLDNRFARNGVAREILDEQTLFQLIKLIICQRNDGRNGTDDTYLRSLVSEIRGLETETSPGRCNILATLLFARCTDDCLETWLGNLLHKNGCQQASVQDNDLPLTESAARDNFGNDNGPSFWEQQYLFCPLILMESDESVYVEHKRFCRLPFEQERTKIGKGSFATVYEVKIARGHMVNQSTGWALQSSKSYAQKEYIDYDAETRKAFEAEFSTIKKFIQAAKSHENILVTKASLEHGNTYSLFFDLAKYSLWDYFEDPTVSITSLEQKKDVFSRTLGLAGALAYLHDELFIPFTGEQLCCYHLDLKPHNILVFEDGGKTIWKISDFGISQIKRIPISRANTVSEHTTTTHFLKIFRRDESPAEPTSGVKNPRDAGTYTAPEARHKLEKVTRASDVWSLGCVLALLLAFLDNQRTGIGDFENARMVRRDDDLFYDSSPPLSGTESRPSPRPSVLRWLDHLTKNAKERSRAEGQVVGLVSDLIQKRMLLPGPEHRIRAKEVERELRSIQRCFTVAPGTSQPLHQRSQVMVERPNVYPRYLGRWVNTIWGRKSVPVNKSSSTWHFKLPGSTRRSKFSCDGKYLAMESSETIVTMSISEIQQRIAGTIHTAPESNRWSDFSLGSQYLCAACYYATLSTGDPSVRHCIDTEVKSRIRRIAVSPNDAMTAFILEEPQQRGDDQKIAVYHTEEMLQWSRTTGEPGSADHVGSSSMRPSTARMAREELPWKDTIKSPADRELPTGGQICHLMFTSDGKKLMAMTQPYLWEPNQEYRYDIFTWDLLEGKRILCRSNKTKGFYNMEHTWRIRAMAPFAHHPTFVAVSSQKIRLGSYEHADDYSASSNPTNDEFLDVVVNEEKDELILIGRSNAIGKVRAFQLRRSGVDGLERVGKGIDTGMGGYYDPTTDCCCLIRETGYGKQKLLLAKIKPRENEGKLSVCYLD